ncbi:murein L,D-transpeptidase catalytic domain-containing protein [Prevotella fusca]
MRFLLIFLLLINFGIKGYWKMKSYSFDSQLKEVWETCHEKGFSEDYCILVDFSRPSGEDRIAIIDLNTLSVLDTGPCAHGRGKGNSAWKPIFSNKEGSRCSSLGHFKIAEKSYSATVGLRFALDGLDDSNCNARRRNILIHSPDTWALCTISPPISHSPMLRGDALPQALLCSRKSNPSATRARSPSFFMLINHLDE